MKHEISVSFSLACLTKALEKFMARIHSFPVQVSFKFLTNLVTILSYHFSLASTHIQTLFVTAHPYSVL